MKLRGFLWWWEMVLLAVQIAVIAVVGPRKRENGGNLGESGLKVQRLHRGQ
jgi:hypothetical protein